MNIDEQLEELDSQLERLRTKFLFRNVDEEELLRFYVESTAKLNAIIEFLVILVKNQNTPGALEDSKKRFEVFRRTHLIKTLKKRITKSNGHRYSLRINE